MTIIAQRAAAAFFAILVRSFLESFIARAQSGLLRKPQVLYLVNRMKWAFDG